MAADWSSLPLDLLSPILMKLKTWEDFIYFSGMCCWWNYVSVLIVHKWRPTPMPWLLLAENTEENPSCLRKIYNLSNNKCYNFRLPDTFGTRCLGSAYGWVALLGRDFNVQLFNPITKAQILFPSLERMMILHGSSNFDKNKEEDIIRFLRNFICKLIVLKVPRGDHDEFVIMAIDCYCVYFARHGDQSWTVLLERESNPEHDDLITDLMMVDVVGMNEHVFAMYNDGSIRCWSVMEMYGLEGVKPIDYCLDKPGNFNEFNQGDGKRYLVQSGSDLLMVLREKDFVQNPEGDVIYDIVYRTLGFKVYKLIIKNKSWEEIDDLGDVALFVGNNSSMSVSGALAKGLHRSIYFSDDETEYWDLPTKFGGHDMGVYDLKCGKILQFYEGDDIRSFFCPSTWFIT